MSHENQQYGQQQNQGQQQRPRGVTPFPEEHTRRLHAEVAGSAILESDVKRRLAIAREFATVVGEQISGAPPEGYEVNFVVVPVDRVADVYPVNPKGDAPPYDHDPVGVSGSMLHTLASQLGQIAWSIKVRAGKEEHVWEADATATITFSTGTMSTFNDTYRLDMREGQQDAIAAGKGVAKKRANAHKLVSTGAQNRCLRKALGIRGGLRRDEVRPFVITRLVWTGRASRPEYQTMVTQQGMVRMMLNQAAAFGAHGGLIVGQAVNGLFGGGGALAPQLSVGPASVVPASAAPYDPMNDPDAPMATGGGHTDDDDAPSPRPPATTATGGGGGNGSGGGGRRAPTTCPWDDTAATKRGLAPRYKKGERLEDMTDEGLAALANALDWKVQNEQDQRWIDFASDHLRVVRRILAARESDAASS